VTWVPFVDSDSDGEVNQPSFVLGSSIVTDETGTPSSIHPSCRPVGEMYDQYHDSGGAAADDEWKKMFGSSFNLQALRDSKDGPMDDSVSGDLLEQVLDQFQKELLHEDGSLDSAVDGILDVLRQDIVRIPVGRTRSNDGCTFCTGPLFEGDEEPDIEICMMCNEWVHRDVCMIEHIGTHVPSLLCLGMRKRNWERAHVPDDSRAPVGSEDPSTQPCEPSLEPAAGAGRDPMAPLVQNTSTNLPGSGVTHPRKKGLNVQRSVHNVVPMFVSVGRSCVESKNGTPCSITRSSA